MKQGRFLLLTLAALGLICVRGYAVEVSMGYVNFKNCIEKSRQGQQERSSFEALKSQMNEALEKTDKELVDLAKKLEDQDYMDGLSPAAEDELKNRFQMLNQEFARAQNQYYQLLNQANYRLVQTLHDHVSQAAESVRSSKRLSLILNEESTFACASSLDVTEAVIAEMDRRFETKNTASIDHP